MLSVPVRSKYALFSSSLIALAMIALALIGATSAHAQADNFANGNGQDGTPVNITGAAVPNAVAPVSGAVPQGATSLTRGTVRAGSGTGAVTFQASRLVMVYQTNGTSVAPTSGDQGVYTLSSSTAGHWEFARISTVAGTTLNFDAPLIYSYSSGNTQVIAVPEYAALNVTNAAATISAQAWDGTSGGVVAFLVQGTLSFTAAGTVTANSLGFRGALTYAENAGSASGCTAMDSPAVNSTYGMKGEGFFTPGFLNATPATATTQQGRGNYLNSGGGGDCFNAGGGGGGNGGQGGTGGNSLVNYPAAATGNQPVGGLGGSDLTYNVTSQLAFGGGGGGGERNNAGNGNGGIGGGVVLVRGGTLTGSGNFRANGGAGRAGNLDGTPYDGAGGGGAGGSVLLRFVNGTTCGAVSATGGVGGNNGTNGGFDWTPGAGGGGGKVHVQGSSITCPATVTGGAAGTATGGANGATAGGAGVSGTTASGLANPTLTIAAPAAAAVVGATPTASGTATAASTVFVYIDGVFSGNATLVGTNWTYAVPALTAGSHTIMAYSEIAGVDSTSVTNTFTVDTTAPAAPVITTPAANPFYSSTTTPTVAGTAEANSTVRVYDGAGTGTLIGTTTADGSGNWTLSSSALATGSHTIHATARDVALNVSADSATKTIVIDTTAPTVALTAPTNGGSYNTTTPTVTFTLTETNPGTSRCIIDGVLPGTVCTTGSALPAMIAGSHNVTVQHTDLAGNIGTSSTNTFTIDLTAPVAPSISTPAADLSTNDTTPTIGGSSEIGSTVRVYDGAGTGTLVGTSVANGSGVWVLSPDPTLSVGVHNLHAAATDAAGNISPDSSIRQITIDTTAPAAPVITTPAASPSYSPITTPTVSGTAEANSTVRVYDGAGTGTLIGTATTNGSGNWTLSTSALSTGSHTVHAVATDAANNSSLDSTTKTIVIDTTAPSVTLTAPTNGGSYNTTTPTVTFTLTETNPGTSRCIIDGVLPGTVCTTGSALPAMIQGSHNLTIQHTDLAGNVGSSSTNTFTIDTTAPVAPSITTPATSPFPTNDTTPLVAGTAEANSTVKVYDGAGSGTLIGTTTADGSGNWTLSTSVLTAGSHTIHATSTDIAGNVSPDSTTKVITIDLTAPAVSITTPASNGLTVGPNGNLVFTATDAVGPVTTTCQIDGGSAVSCTSPFAYSGLTTGTHSFTVTALDGAGNSAAAVRSVTVDATSPDTNITGNPAAVTNLTTANFTFTSTEGSSTFECQIDGGAIAACTTPKAYAGLTQGSHTFSVRAIDQYGNVDQTPASYTWTVDTTAPIAPTISTPGSDIVTSDTTPTIGGSAEINSTVRVYDGPGTGTLVGTAVANGSGVWVLSPDPTLSVGTHTLHATSTDAAGNVSADSSNRVITIDTTAPTVTLTTPNTGTTPANGSSINTTTPVITFTVTDANPAAASTCVLDGAPTTCTSGYSPAALADGVHTIYVTHTDLAGNVGTSATNSFTVDTVAPAAPVITSGPNAPVASTSATFTFTGEAGATYECYIDSPVTWTACSSPKNYPGLAQGAHTFHVRQTDAAGNVSGESNRAWSVDTVGPPAPSVSGPSGTVGTTSATINFNDTESPVTYKCSLDGALATACTSPASLSGLADGPHSYAVFAIDTLGNVGATTTINWTVDSSLFTAGITAGPLGTVATNNNSLSFTATIVSGTTFQCKVDGGSFAACTSPFSTGALSDGSHTFSVFAVNGSQNSATVSRTWTIDTAGPALTITAPTNLQTVGPNGNVTFTATDVTGPITYTCKIDAGSAASCGSPYVFTSLSDGAHSVTVVATDGVGNSSTVVRNFNVDATPPNTTITANPASATNSTGASFSFTSTEAPSTFECALDGGPIAACTTPKVYAGLAQGSHTFSVRAIDQYGNVDASPASYTWTVDTTAPVAPSINTPASDIVTTDTTPSVGGLAEANSTVRVYEGATLIGTATADGSGNWSLSPDPTFAEGPHALVARATDSAGNTSVNSGTRTITIDTIAPVVSITSPTTGSVTSDNTPNIVFTATDANLTLVQCSVDGGAAVNCTSPWTTPVLSDGLHTISVLAADGTGSQQTVDSVTFTVDTTAPNAPLITTPATDISTTNLRPTISGTGEPNSTIKVYDGATQIGTTTANGSGNWSFTPTSDLSEAAHPLHVTATDGAGNTSSNSNIRTITVDLTAPSAPVINAPTSNVSTSSLRPPVGGTAEPNSTVTVYDGATSIGTATTNGSGSWTFTPASDLSEAAHPFHATATDGAGNTGGNSNIRTITIDATAPAAPAITTPATNLTTAVNQQPVGGTAEPNSTVTVYDGPTQIGTATTDGGGNWSLATDPTFAEGVHPITAWATDAEGNTSQPSAIRTITIDNTAPAKPVVTTPASGITTGDSTPTISGTAEANASVQVFVDGNSIGTVTADNTGHWTINSPSLTDGPHNATARATDAAGNTGATSDARPFTVDTTPPDGAVGEVPGSGGVGKNPTFDISTTDGTATIACALDGGASAPCNSPFTPTGTLAPGTHTLVVTFTDPSGNVTTRTITFVIAGAAVTPPTPDPTQCLGGGVVITNLFPKGSKATVSGFARQDLIGKTVTITYKPTKKAVATAVVAADGSFTATFKAPPKKDWNKNTTTYQAAAGSFKSKQTKLVRRTSSTIASYVGGKLTVTGTVTLPLVKGGGATIQARTGCSGTWKTIGITKFRPNGTFSLTAPYVGSGVIFVRVSAVIGNPSKRNAKFKTNSFVVPVIVK